MGANKTFRTKTEKETSETAKESFGQPTEEEMCNDYHLRGNGVFIHSWLQV